MFAYEVRMSFRRFCPRKLALSLAEQEAERDKGPGCSGTCHVPWEHAAAGRWTLRSAMVNW